MTPAEFKAIRLASNLRQIDVAEALGVHVQTVKSWEAGRYPIDRLTALGLRAITDQLPKGEPLAENPRRRRKK